MQQAPHANAHHFAAKQASSITCVYIVLCARARVRARVCAFMCAHVCAARTPTCVRTRAHVRACKVQSATCWPSPAFPAYRTARKALSCRQALACALPSLDRVIRMLAQLKHAANATKEAWLSLEGNTPRQLGREAEWRGRWVQPECNTGRYGPPAASPAVWERRLVVHGTTLPLFARLCVIVCP